MKISPWVQFFMRATIAVAIPSASFSQTAPSSAVFVNNLMPEPASLTAAPGRFLLTPQFSAVTTRFDNPRLDAAIREAMRQLRQKDGGRVRRTVRLSRSWQSADDRGAGSRRRDSICRRGRVLYAFGHVHRSSPRGCYGRRSHARPADARATGAIHPAANTCCPSSPSAIRRASAGGA